MAPREGAARSDVSRRRRSYWLQALDAAWGGDGWIPPDLRVGNHETNDGVHNGILQYLWSITLLARRRKWPLETLWALPDGRLRPFLDSGTRTLQKKQTVNMFRTLHKQRDEQGNVDDSELVDLKGRLIGLGDNPAAHTGDSSDDEQSDPEQQPRHPLKESKQSKDKEPAKARKKAKAARARRVKQEGAGDGARAAAAGAPVIVNLVSPAPASPSPSPVPSAPLDAVMDLSEARDGLNLQIKNWEQINIRVVALRAELTAFRGTYDGVKADMTRQRDRLLAEAGRGFRMTDKRLVSHFKSTKKARYEALVSEIFEDLGPLEQDLKQREKIVGRHEDELRKADRLIAHYAREVARLQGAEN